MSDKPSKNLYHSAAVQLGQVTCIIKSDVNKSKYSGKPDYCVLLINGEEKNYSVENAACGAVLKANKGKSVVLEFLGGRDDASISVVGQPQAAPQQEPPPDLRNQPQRERTPAPKAEPKTVAESIKEVKRLMMQQANLREIALDVAVYMIKRHNSKHPDFPMTANDVRELSSGFYIGAERRGWADSMPTAPLDDKPKAGAK
jgi:hypothetical protein